MESFLWIETGVYKVDGNELKLSMRNTSNGIPDKHKIKEFELSRKIAYVKVLKLKFKKGRLILGHEVTNGSQPTNNKTALAWYYYTKLDS